MRTVFPSKRFPLLHLTFQRKYIRQRNIPSNTEDRKVVEMMASVKL